MKSRYFNDFKEYIKLSTDCLRGGVVRKDNKKKGLEQRRR